MYAWCCLLLPYSGVENLDYYFLCVVVCFALPIKIPFTVFLPLTSQKLLKK